MYRTCVAVVDASRARLFNHERAVEADGLHDALVERLDLVNPARRLRPSQLFSSTRPGSGRAGGLHFGLDDHRSNHLEKLDADFARDITTAIASELAANPAQQLIVCASPHMLGALRQRLHELRRPPLVVKELPRDLVKSTPSKLRDQLAHHGLLQPRA